MKTTHSHTLYIHVHVHMLLYNVHVHVIWHKLCCLSDLLQRLICFEIDQWSMTEIVNVFRKIPKTFSLVLKESRHAKAKQGRFLISIIS